MIACNERQFENSHTVAFNDAIRPFDYSENEKMTRIPSGYIVDLPYEADGITPRFDELFEILAEQERNAPPLTDN